MTTIELSLVLVVAGAVCAVISTLALVGILALMRRM